MRYVCGECGREIPDDMDFCPHCGSLRSKAMTFGDSGEYIIDCPQCGERADPGDKFCRKCGQPFDEVRRPIQPFNQMDKKASAAIMIALVAGFFNIFGLGHLILKSYTRAVMFFVISALIWYLNGGSMFSSSFAIVILTVVVYFYQAMDVMRVAYSQRKE